MCVDDTKILSMAYRLLCTVPVQTLNLFSEVITNSVALAMYGTSTNAILASLKLLLILKLLTETLLVCREKSTKIDGFKHIQGHNRRFRGSGTTRFNL